MEKFNDEMADMSCTCGMKLRKPPNDVALAMALTVCSRFTSARNGRRGSEEIILQDSDRIPVNDENQHVEPLGSFWITCPSRVAEALIGTPYELNLKCSFQEDNWWVLKSWDFNDNGAVMNFCVECRKDIGGEGTTGSLTRLAFKKESTISKQSIYRQQIKSREEWCHLRPSTIGCKNK